MAEEEQECNDAADVDTSDTSDAPATSVMNTYLLVIQARLKYERMKKSEHMLLPSGTPNRTSAPDEDTDDFNDFGTSGRITTLVPPTKSEYRGLRVGYMVLPQYQCRSPIIEPSDHTNNSVHQFLEVGLTSDNLPTVRQNRKPGHQGKDACSRKKRSCA
jgi:hypothetical protein